MKEYPILFSTPMVKAILEGRKTRTRRIIKHQPEGVVSHAYVDQDKNWGIYGDNSNKTFKCPYGGIGDILWVRETFFELVHPETSKPYDPSRYMYLASYNPEKDGEVYLDDGDGGMALNKDGSAKSPWKPSIHMPRSACRILLERTNTRIERLQDISPADAIAEGITPTANSQTIDCDTKNPVDDFKQLWQQINGEKSWNENPFVWVIEFKHKK